MALQEEKQVLEQKLVEVPKLQTRLDEIKAVLEERDKTPNSATTTPFIKENAMPFSLN